MTCIKINHCCDQLRTVFFPGRLAAVDAALLLSAAESRSILGPKLRRVGRRVHYVKLTGAFNVFDHHNCLERSFPSARGAYATLLPRGGLAEPPGNRHKNRLAGEVLGEVSHFLRGTNKIPDSWIHCEAQVSCSSWRALSPWELDRYDGTPLVVADDAQVDFGKGISNTGPQKREERALHE